MRKRWLQVVHEIAKKDERVVFIGSDLSADPAIKRFQAEVPNRFFMEGVSEMHIVGMASGLALTGKICFVNTIATFLSRRCFEQNVIDVGLANVPVRLIAGGGGLVYAPLGPTHLAIDDIGIMRTIPNMTVIAPCDADEMERAMRASIEYPGPIYFRVAKGGETVVSKPEHGFTIGKGVWLKRGADVGLVSTGITAQLCLEAATKLEAQGLSVSVLHLHTVKPIDIAALGELFSKSKVVLAVEEHLPHGGLGSAVAEQLAESDIDRKPKFKRVSLDDYFPDEYGSQESLMKKYGVSVDSVVHTAQSLLNG